jgi:hypothetical protein
MTNRSYKDDGLLGLLTLVANVRAFMMMPARSHSISSADTSDSKEEESAETEAPAQFAEVREERQGDFGSELVAPVSPGAGFEETGAFTSEGAADVTEFDFRDRVSRFFLDLTLPFGVMDARTQSKFRVEITASTAAMTAGAAWNHSPWEWNSTRHSCKNCSSSHVPGTAPINSSRSGDHDSQLARRRAGDADSPILIGPIKPTGLMK